MCNGDVGPDSQHGCDRAEAFRAVAKRCQPYVQQMGMFIGRLETCTVELGEA